MQNAVWKDIRHYHKFTQEMLIRIDSSQQLFPDNMSVCIILMIDTLLLNFNIHINL